MYIKQTERDKSQAVFLQCTLHFCHPEPRTPVILSAAKDLKILQIQDLKVLHFVQDDKAGGKNKRQNRRQKILCPQHQKVVVTAICRHHKRR